MNDIGSGARPPLFTESPSEEDLLGYEKLSRIICSQLALAEPPFVYAICGGWGSGKSTMLQYVIRHLPLFEPRGAIAYFNAWRAMNQDDVLVAMFSAISDQLRCSAFLPNGVRDSAMGDTLAGAVAFSPDALRALLPAGARTTGHFLSRLPGFSLIRRTLRVRQEAAIFRALGALLRELADHHVEAYVLVDEVDRCPPSQAVQIVQAAALLATEPDVLSAEARFTTRNWGTWWVGEGSKIPIRFVLSLDESFIMKAFKEVLDLDDDDAARYLEKFIQFRYHLPVKDFTRLIEWHLNRYGNRDRFPPGIAKEFQEVIRILGVNTARTVKLMLRYVLTWNDSHLREFEAERRMERELKATKLDLSPVLAWRILGIYLFEYAGLKVLYSDQVESLLRKRVLPRILYAAWEEDTTSENQTTPDEDSTRRIKEVADEVRRLCRGIVEAEIGQGEAKQANPQESRVNTLQLAIGNLLDGLFRQ